METQGESLLSKSITKDEYSSIDQNLRDKIETALNEHMEDFLTAKALFESSKASNSEQIKELNEQLNAVRLERDDFKVRVDALAIHCEETTARLKEANAELCKLRETVNRCEKNAEVLRRERDTATDERQIASNLMERRNGEVERLTSDVKVLTEQLRGAVAAKCEAIAAADEVASKKLELEFKEKRLESERSLLTQQNIDLTADLGKRAEELTKQRRESTGNILSLQSKLAEKDEELRISKEQNSKILETNTELTAQLDKLSEKLREQYESESKTTANYQQEIKAQTKLADLYKSMQEEAEAKSNELTGAVRELQRLLQDASSQYGELETKLAQTESDHDNLLQKKEETINALRDELKHANTLLQAVKQESSEEAISRLSPLAASTSKLLKSGLTLTQIYTQYAQVSQELMIERHENTRLKEYIKKIMQEIDEKAPILQKQRDDYNYAVTTMESLTVKVDDLETEHCKMRRVAAEAESTVAFLTRENKRLSGSVADLGRQVCYLLKELEAARGNTIPLHETPENLNADKKTTAEVISKKLVTFRDIQEIQLNNQKLLAVLRELSAEKEEAEIEKDSEKVLTLKGSLKRAEAKISDLQDRETILGKEVEFLKSQRDVYARLFKQHVKPGSLPVDADKSGSLLSNLEDMIPEKLVSSPVKQEALKEFQAQKRDDPNRIALEELKKEFETYRSEKNTNEKMLNETINNLREELNKAIAVRSELVARAEYNEEKSKTLHANAKTLSTRIDALEKQCKSYITTIGKHEQSLQHLRSEAMSAMSKLSVAEVTAANLKQENQLLRDTERRLVKERETERKQKHGQEMLMANLEALKVKFECSEAEARMRLETRLDDATSECAALRRRLQEEQDRLTRRMELLEQQTNTAKERLEEEKNSRASLVEELETSREKIKQTEANLESITSQLSNAISNSQPVLERDNRIKELEQNAKEQEAEVGGLKEQLSSAKLNCSELSDICQGIEKQLADVTSEFETHKQNTETIITDLKKTESELRSTVTQLEIKLSMSTAAEAEMTAQKDGELATLRSRVESLNTQIAEGKDRCSQLEKEAQSMATDAQEAQAKYSSEMVSRTQAVQELEAVKNELSEAIAKTESLQSEYKNLVETSALEKEALVKKADTLSEQIKTYDEKVSEVSRLNDILQEQLQELGVKVSVMDTSGASTSGDQSLTGDSFRESDKLLEVLRFLRKEKSSALAQAEALRAEKLHLEAETEVLRRQLEETRKALEDERNNKDAPSIIAERHAKLLRKVEMLNELSESNRSLREERDRLSERLTEQEEEARRVEADVVSPARQRSNELLARVEQLTTENAALKNESSMWQQRANQLIEKSNKTSPEDLKRLTLEKENLTKQLNLEREENKTAKAKLEEQLVLVRKEKQEAKNETVGLETSLNEARTELAEAKEEVSKAAERSAKLAADLAKQIQECADSQKKEIQIRQIAKKYKSQFQELTRTVEEERKVRVEPGPSVPYDTEKKIRETEDRIKQMAEQVNLTEAEAEALRKENELLKASMIEREERAKQLLKNARARILTLTEENKTLVKDMNIDRGRPKADLGSDNRITALEARITRLEKEKSEEQAEKERLAREVEVQNQRLVILQRQLDKQQQGSKPSTSSTEKSTNEPPTANIKPLAGPSSSASKQQQTQHSATVTPWRETPFASIRPMSQQTRTVVVLPTSQTTSTSNQPVLVAPQQQVVHTSSTCEGLSSSPTSSHMDYMPATSSAVHNIHQATVILGQHMEAEAGTEENPQPPQHCVPPSPNVSIALVLPQPTTQSPIQEQQQAEAASAENTGVVSASNQEQVSEQSVSASNHTQPPVVPAYYRQVEESGQPVASSQGETSQLAASSQQQAASSSTSVTTTQAGSSNKRPNAPEDPDSKILPPAKRSRIVVSGAEGEMLLRSDGLEVEYQVPTSSQRDQEDDILVISDDEDIPDEGAMEDGQEFEEEGEEEGRYTMEAYSQNEQDLANYEAEGPDIDEGSTTDQDNNEVDINEDSNEVPNQCESSRGVETGGNGGEATSSLSGVSSNQQYSRRPPTVPLINSRHHMLLSYEDTGDDSIVPSTPTLYVPRRTDGFGEAVSSPHVPSARFTFTDQSPTTPTRNVIAGVAQVASEGMDDTRMDLSQLEEGTGRSVPSTPSHVSPQETSGGSEVGQSSQDSGNNSGVNVVGEGGSKVTTQQDVLESRGDESTPSAAPQPHQTQDSVPEDNVDGVSSEGEKSLVVETEEEEGREAEATEGGSSSTITVRGGATARRSARIATRSRTRAAPTPIVWHQEPQVTMAALRVKRKNSSLNSSISYSKKSSLTSFSCKKSPLRGKLKSLLEPLNTSFIILNDRTGSPPPSSSKNSSQGRRNSPCMKDSSTFTSPSSKISPFPGSSMRFMEPFAFPLSPSRNRTLTRTITNPEIQRGSFRGSRQRRSRPFHPGFQGQPRF